MNFSVNLQINSIALYHTFTQFASFGQGKWEKHDKYCNCLQLFILIISYLYERCSMVAVFQSLLFKNKIKCSEMGMCVNLVTK